jgi:hypothetical protein
VSQTAANSDNDDPIEHSCEFINRLNKVFPRHFNASQHLTFDESMAAFKGRSEIKQYLPAKPHKWGYKFWCLASENYLRQLQLYKGKTEEKESDEGMTHDLIIGFLRSYANKNHILYIDNFFTSPLLLLSLAKMQIAVCGSVRISRQGMPKDIISKEWMKTLGRYETKRIGNDDMSLFLWKDRKVVAVLANYSPNQKQIDTVKRYNSSGALIDQPCPRVIKDYFYKARAVDIINQLHYSYVIGRKSIQTASRVIWWLIDVCIVNAFTVHKVGRPDATHLSFRISLMHQLVSMHLADVLASFEREVDRLSLPLASLHYPVNTHINRDCHHCSHHRTGRRQSRFICDGCQVYLCVHPCFGQHHQRDDTCSSQQNKR